MTITWTLKEQTDLDDRWCARLVESDPSLRIGGPVHAYVELISPAPSFGRPKPILSIAFQSSGYARDAWATNHRLAAVAIEREGTSVNSHGSRGAVQVTADRAILGKVFADFFGAVLPTAAWERR